MSNKYEFTAIISIIWIILLAINSIQYENRINNFNNIVNNYREMIMRERKHPDSIVINCFGCNTRNVRYLYPDSLLKK